MPPEHARTFAGGATETSLAPIVLIAMIIAILLILVLPRKYALVPLFFVLLLVPVEQQVVLGGVHLFVSRILILFGLFKMFLTKLISHGDLAGGGFNSIDRAFLGCSLCQAAAAVLLFRSTDAFVNQSGLLLDFVGGYFLLRFLIQDEEDIFRVIKCFALVGLIVGVCMVGELYTLHNVFGSIGGRLIPDIREGRIRAQGPFSHELMAGAFGATLVTLFVLLWKNGKAKAMAAIGFVGAGLMTWASNSSTSLLSFAAGVLAICFWPMRKSMRKVRWGIVFGLIGLQLVMKAPVWFLIARIDLTGGSSGYHRAELVDTFIRHFWDWWLIGVKDTGVWGWDMWDAQNQFVNVGEAGGLAALVLFIAMISRCFSKLGDARKLADGDSNKEWFLWLLGAALFSHIVTFFGVNYFDQMKFAWFAMLAMVPVVTTPILQSSPVLEPQVSPIFYNSRLGYSSRSIQKPAGLVANHQRTDTRPAERETKLVYGRRSSTSTQKPSRA